MQEETSNPSESAVEENKLDVNKLVAQRREKLAAIREQRQAYPNDFHRDANADQIHGLYGKRSGESLEEDEIRVTVAGRMMAKRIMGKTSFTHVQDGSGRIQLHIRRDVVGDDLYADYKTWDVGDIVGASGTLFRTKTDELTIRVDKLELLVKSLRPLPEKWAGLTDTETRYRQRELDLIMNPEVRQQFRKRTRVIKFIREFLDTLGFLEVETPMLQAIPGGAAARPFKTHHNALDADFYLRIAPELYLKRLVVGGFDKVYEINRNFRNEGLSTRHNPEFTMLEFYQSFARYDDLMDLIETMLRDVALAVCSETSLTWQGETIDLGAPFTRLSMEQAVAQFNPEMEVTKFRDAAYLKAEAERLGIPAEAAWGWGKLLTEIFEKTVESKLINPTYITAYPAEVSPLARRNDADQEITDRFELFIGGREIANGFSELNDPEDQAARFEAQVAAKEAGDDEAMYFDAAYVRALEHGLPPTAGAGIGIDRLVMLLTDAASIRDVLLFPQLRPE